ncbi:hypothetical protein R3W88_031913 [Solanum pinnatisectum]|uniref:Uncharacterized protein n=1 Tax=Solanum pinnatisectum TaxID=50273 RepID=A0AAV9LMN5_9SOLN|nr:hypothetical protein R3W88_031913 [Solanum pinnatisectum]
MFMLSSASSSHTYDFLDYQTFEKDNLIHGPKIPQKKVILPTGEHMPASDIEATLNWEYENAMCQNRAYTSIVQSIRGVAHSQVKIHDKMSTMEKNMDKMSTQHIELIKALEKMLQTVQFDICPPITSLSHFIEQQRSGIASIKEKI